MKITCVSDLHGDFPALSGGDLLLLSGDYTSCDRTKDWVAFFDWLKAQPYTKKVGIAGNHDMFLEHCCSSKEAHEMGFDDEDVWTYLKDTSTEFQGIKIYGTPWNRYFSGINPKCTAFNLRSENDLNDKFKLIPLDTQILLTHTPASNLLDSDYRFGSTSLLDQLDYLVKLKLHLFGHIHEGYGMQKRNGVWHINASHQNRYYEPVNDPIDLIYEDLF